MEVVKRANLLAFQRYKPGVYPGPVVLFHAEGRHVPPAQDYRLGWQQLIMGKVEVYTAPGGDSGMMLLEPHVRSVAAQLKRCLERAQASASSTRPGA
jgi:hypothetical protein